MSEATERTGPVVTAPSVVSAALLAEVSKKVLEQGLVFWVDTDGQYTGFVDRIAETAGRPLSGIDGLHWKQLLASSRMVTDGSRLKAIVSSLPTAHNGSIELYRNGVRPVS